MLRGFPVTLPDFSSAGSSTAKVMGPTTAFMGVVTRDQLPWMGPENVFPASTVCAAVRLLRSRKGDQPTAGQARVAQGTTRIHILLPALPEAQ
jgi:hypothetical protein